MDSSFPGLYMNMKLKTCWNYWPYNVAASLRHTVQRNNSTWSNTNKGFLVQLLLPNLTAKAYGKVAANTAAYHVIQVLK